MLGNYALVPLSDLFHVRPGAWREYSVMSRPSMLHMYTYVDMQA
jgi:hypothetical protein